jgi:hypothetical protein
MKSLKLIIILLFIGSTSFIEPDKFMSITHTYVYICKGPASKRYHYKQNCRGLGNCSTAIYMVTLTEAKVQYRRTLCGYED